MPPYLKLPEININEELEPTDAGTSNALEWRRTPSDILDGLKPKIAILERAITDQSGGELAVVEKRLITAHLVRVACEAATTEDPIVYTQLSAEVTERSIELYDQPSLSVARRLIQREFSQALSGGEKSPAAATLTELYTPILTRPAPEIANDAQEFDIEKEQVILREVEDYLRNKYASFYEIIEAEIAKHMQNDSGISHITLVSLLKKGFKDLIRRDERWRTWEIKYTKDSHSSVSPENLAICISENTQYIPGEERKILGFITHEVLFHAQQFQNGLSTSDPALGLRYIECRDVLEGLANVGGGAVGIGLPVAVPSQYINTALAVGGLSPEPYPRSKILERVSAVRAVAGIQNKDFSTPNRIFRAHVGNPTTLGPVLTVDTSYYHGYVKILAYIQKKRVEGVPVGKTIEYLLRGIIDPTSPKHHKELFDATGIREPMGAQYN